MGYGSSARRDMSAMAWWLIPLGIMITVLILLFGKPEEPEKSLVVTESTADYQRVRLPYVGDATGDLDRQFRPLSSKRHENLQSQLKQFRADYRPAAPRLQVWAKPELANRVKVAEQLGRDLSKHELGKKVEKLPEPPTTVTAPLLLVCAEEDKRIAQQLLAALSVYLTGEVELYFDDTTSLSEMKLYLLGDPAFDRQGVAVFSR